MGVAGVRTWVYRSAAAMAGGLLVLCWSTPAGAAPPAPLTSFQPADVLPGSWTSNVDSQPMHMVGPDDGPCDGVLRSWRRAGDDVRLGLGWFECGAADLAGLARSRALGRLANPGLNQRAVLGEAEQVVRLDQTTLARGWQQDGLEITVLCTGELELCATLTGRVVTHLSQRLSGAPVVSRFLPAGSAIIGGFVVYWLLFLGLPLLFGFIGATRYDTGPLGPRVVRVDRAAASLRWRHRGRRIGQLVAIVGAVGLGARVFAFLDRGAVPGVVAVAVFTVLTVAGLILARACWHPQLSARWLRYRPHLSRLNFRRVLAAVLTGGLGLIAAAVPVVALLALVVVSFTGDLAGGPRLAAGLLFAGTALGFGVDTLARRLRARTAREAIGDDRKHRKAILYLRNFGDDGSRIPVAPLTRRGLFATLLTAVNPLRRARFEELLARVLGRWGPVVALNDPRLRLPTLGAAKVEPLGDDWRDRVRQEATGAHAVVVSATPTAWGQGLAWELDLLAQAVPHGKVVLILGPDSSRRTPPQQFAWFLSETEHLALFHPLGSGWVPGGTLVLVHVPHEGKGSWYAWTARRRTAWTYAAAVDAAFTFAERAWSTEPSANLVSASLTEEVSAALDDAAAASLREQAATDAEKQEPADAPPIDTRSVLAALLRRSGNADWSRIRLHGGDIDAVERAVAVDPDPTPDGYWRGVPMTTTMRAALRLATQTARRYRLWPIPPGLLVLCLVADPNTAAAFALGAVDPASHERLLTLVQDDLLGVRIQGFTPAAVARPVPSPAAKPASAPPGRLRPLAVVLALVLVAIFGGAPNNMVGQEQAFSILAVVGFGLILGPFLLWATATATGGGGRYARLFVIVGTFLIAGLDLVALIRAGILG